jgi:UDP-N-acetylmuramoylalanine-D-glutamate ligase
MLIAAVAVSPGISPVSPLLRALAKRVVQLTEVDELEFMHEDRMFARV